MTLAEKEGLVLYVPKWQLLTVTFNSWQCFLLHKLINCDQHLFLSKVGYSQSFGWFFTMVAKLFSKVFEPDCKVYLVRSDQMPMSTRVYISTFYRVKNAFEIRYAYSQVLTPQPWIYDICSCHCFTACLCNVLKQLNHLLMTFTPSKSHIFP